MTPIQRWIRGRQRLVRLVAVLSLLLGGTVALSVASAAPASADPTCGTVGPPPTNVVLAGTAWLDGGGVNIYSNGASENTGVNCGGESYVGSVDAGGEWQCTELVNRLYLTKGWITAHWHGDGDTLVDNLPSGLTAQDNGSITSIVPGDAVTFNGDADNSAGHVAIVSDVNGNTISIVSQNASGAVTRTITYTPSTKELSGQYGYTVQAVVHASGNSNTGSGGGSAPNEQVPGNWVGNGTTDVAVFRPGGTPPSWHYDCNGSGGSDCASQNFGVSGDIPVPGYYFGAQQLDWAVYRPSDETWYIMNQATKDTMTIPYGLSGDIPVPGDWEGNGTTQPAIFRPSDDTWHVYENDGTDVTVATFGSSGDIPVPMYWDGGSKMEPGVFRPSTGTWYYDTPTGQVYQQFGTSGDIPVPGYYTGASKPDFAVFRPSNDTWYVMDQATRTQDYAQSYGLSGDIPVPGYYMGNGHEQAGVFRPSNNTWYWLNFQNGGTGYMGWGLSGDIPALSTLSYPLLVDFGLCGSGLNC